MAKTNTVSVVGIGAGGHARVVVDIIRAVGRNIEIIGLLDNNPEMRGARVDGIEVLGDDSEISRVRRQGVSAAFIGVGALDGLEKRRKIFAMLKKAGLGVVDAIHPKAVVSAFAEIADGVTIMPGAVVNAGARIGQNVIVNSQALVEHDCDVGKHSHIAIGALLAGGVRIGEGTLVGAGAIVRQGLSVGSGCVIGAGAVVVNDVADNTLAFGVPARVSRDL